ncbi:MAG: helix-turn-helix transcriptional regulator [Lawsonibacter sp.]|nr:helix-turn-helix transcriptional regulator [Lawsonibacter sp.]
MSLFHERLRICRQTKNMSQEDIAHELHIRYSTYCRYERGGTEPTISDAARIADYFGVSLDYLAGRTERQEPWPDAPQNQ